MIKRYWHGLQKETNAIGMGCWQIAGAHSIDGRPNGWGFVDEKEAIDIIIKAVEGGIDFFDTAQAYNNGKSEELLGKALKQTSGNVVICSKIVLKENEIKTLSTDSDFENRIDESLKRLGIERLDILLIHNPPDDVNWREFNSSIFTKLQKVGKIGIFGVSTRGLRGAENVVDAKFGTVVEWVFNLFERRPVDILFPAIEKNKFNFIARSPLSRGLINSKYLIQQPDFNNDDFRSTLPSDWVEWTIESLKKIHSNGLQSNELVKQAITYCLQYKAVTSAIIGIKSRKQLEEMLKINSCINDNSHLQNHLLKGIPQCFPKWV